MLLLSLLLIPLLGAAILGGWSGLCNSRAKHLAIIWALVPLVLVVFIGSHQAFPATGVLAEWESEWLPDAGISLRFAVDGTSWLFLLLTSLVTLFALAASVRLDQGGRGYCALILVLEGMLFGVFSARHFVPWFLCWEMTLIPSYLLIRLWGGAGAPRAALRFFIMTLGGSVFMLLGFLALQLATGTMDFSKLSDLAANHQLVPLLAATFVATGHSGQFLLGSVAVCVFLGLAVKLPVFPFHAWLPAAYAEAPTPVTMLLTGLLSKMGVYGLLRILLPIFPEVLPALAPSLMVLAVATVLLGAVAALAQRDLKRILAYSSVNHLGYCAMAVVAAAAVHTDRSAHAAAISGTILQAFNHGIIASTIFFCIGLMEQRSGGARTLADFGGLRSRAPVLCGLMGMAIFASLGLPGLSGFVGEFLMFTGVFALVPWAAAVSVIGLLLTAVFFLRMVRLVFHGPLNPACAKWPDLTSRERWILAPAIALIIIPGLWPPVLLHCLNADTARLLDLLRIMP
ncbi:MAG: NADH-quinone oxidoreductase subunit M [Verrucomicrobia bacterium]|nr:NADH-quinone oxidoreductase subunit M [Verrucomicrobiota bacterium]